MIRVRRPGWLTTVQDDGRRGYAHLGVPTAGACDRRAFALGNRLVGNEPTASVLEVTGSGPELEFTADAWIAMTGGRIDARLDGRDGSMDIAVAVRAGQVLALGAVTSGLRAYVAVRGGIDVPPVLGSRSADTLSGLGPAALRAGDRLQAGDRRVGPPYADIAPTPEIEPEPLLRIVAGPRDDAFDAAALAALTGTPYTVTDKVDRAGARLDGPPLARRNDAELRSEGMVEGALQVPPDGKPILFLANHPTTGGYPVIAVVATADLPLAAQARPGTRLRFRLVSVTEARRALRRTG